MWSIERWLKKNTNSVVFAVFYWTIRNVWKRLKAVFEPITKIDPKSEVATMNSTVSNHSYLSKRNWINLTLYCSQTKKMNIEARDWTYNL